jgi:arginyl-tRNA synthetase
MNIKEELAIELGNKNYESLLSIPPLNSGDYCLPCFLLSKELKKPPMVISKELESNFKGGKLIEKVVSVGPYLNIYLNKAEVSKLIIEDKSQNFGLDCSVKNKTYCVDYSSINIAKHMHIGHLSTTIIGNVICNVARFLGYKVVGINYVGDYGTPFGEMICAYKHWGSKEEVEEKGVDALQDYYIRFHSEETPELMDEAREWFKKIDEKDKETLAIYNWFKEVTIKECDKYYKLLGITFDSWKGESAYSDESHKIVEELNKKGLTKISQGATIVDLDEYKLGACLVQKTDGSSLYTTRDIAAAIDRYNTYHFDKSLYVTDVSQNLHFAQFFKVLELMGYDWAKNLVHVNYGRLSTPEGKISSRNGKMALLKDIFDQAIEKAKQVFKDRGEEVNEDVATKVGVSAIVFGAIKNNRINDAVFDINKALNFEGETSVYIQYTVARIYGILNKLPKFDKSKINYEALNNDDTLNLLKSINELPTTILKVLEDYEPCYLSRLLLDISTKFNKFYLTNKVLCENEEDMSSRVSVCELTKNALELGMKLLGINILEKM